jgi:hypothetical protein
VVLENRANPDGRRNIEGKKPYLKDNIELLDKTLIKSGVLLDLSII